MNLKLYLKFMPLGDFMITFFFDKNNRFDLRFDPLKMLTGII